MTARDFDINMYYHIFTYLYIAGFVQSFKRIQSKIHLDMHTYTSMKKGLVFPILFYVSQIYYYKFERLTL